MPSTLGLNRISLDCDPRIFILTESHDLYSFELLHELFGILLESNGKIPRTQALADENTIIIEMIVINACFGLK
jgi:hypothetical protein